MQQDPMEQPAQVEQEAPEQAPGGAAALLGDINDKMMSLMDLLDKAGPSIDDDDKAQLASVIQGFQGFAQSLNEAPGAKKPMPQEPGLDQVPVEAGAAKVQKAY